MGRGLKLCVPVEGELEELCNPGYLNPHCLPLFLLLIHGHSARPKRYNQKQAADNWGGLKEVVLEEVVHGFVGGDGPESVEVDVDSQKPHDEGQRSQLGFEADGHQDNEGSPNHVL